MPFPAGSRKRVAPIFSRLMDGDQEPLPTRRRMLPRELLNSSGVAMPPSDGAAICGVAACGMVSLHCSGTSVCADEISDTLMLARAEKHRSAETCRRLQSR